MTKRGSEADVTFASFAYSLLQNESIWRSAAPDHEGYNGLANGWLGWAWCVAQLHDAGVVALNKKLLNILRKRLPDAGPFEAKYSGYFIGPFGPALIASILATREPDFLPILQAEINKLANLPNATEGDLHYGAAGAVVALYQMHRRHPQLIPRPLIERFCTQFLTLLNRQLLQPAPMLGLAHGVVGYALGAEVADRLVGTPDLARVRSWATTALERSILRDARGRPSAWPMQLGGDKPYIYGWCAGPPGITLALLHIAKFSGYRGYDALIEIGLEMTSGRRLALISPVAFLCCGRLSIAEMYIAAAEFTADTRLRSKARRAFASSDFFQNRPPPKEILKLHRGALGWIYVWFELHNPGLLPSVGLDIYR